MSGSHFAHTAPFRADSQAVQQFASAGPRGGRSSVFSVAYYALAATIVVAVAFCGWAVSLQRRRRRLGALQDLQDHADRLEVDLKDCRERLQRAHAVMSSHPEQPAAGEIEARHAVDSGLKALLRQRIWIRDKAPSASQRELDEAVDALLRARHQLEPRLRDLDDAQAALDTAVREQIHKGF